MARILARFSRSGHCLLSGRANSAHPHFLGHTHRHVRPRNRTQQPQQDPTTCAAASTSWRDSADRVQTPWHFGFQCNERYLQWEDSAQAQLVRIWLAREMGITPEEVDEKLQALGNLLPDMVAKMGRARADVLYQLLKDPRATAEWLVGLKAVLPKCDISQMVTSHPQLMLSVTVEQLRSKMESISAALPGVDVQALVSREPLLLRADIPSVLKDVSRLVPGVDPVQFLVSNPGMVLDMEVSGQPSTLEFN